jgi:hypothetical protein
MYQSLLEADLIGFKKILISLFASITTSLVSGITLESHLNLKHPYNNYVNNNILSYEGYYASVIYAYLSSLGLNIIAEDVTNKGRIDLTIILNDKVYILEFKVLNSTPKTNTALKQIQEKKYHEKYLSKYDEIYQIGIIFNEKKKNIVKFNHKSIKSNKLNH